MNTNDLKVMYLDIETYREMILVGGYIPREDRWVLFEISQRINQMDGMCKFLREEPVDYYVTFNGVLFDGQVLQYMLDNQDKWFDKSWEEVCSLVYQFVQDLIDNQNYELPPKYKEQYMDIKQIDLFLLFHMDNQARRCSLKWCEFSMDEDIEELPIDHSKVGLTVKDIEDTIEYWKNDIRATGALYNYALGETEHKAYKGKNKIQLRLDLIEEMDLPWTAINWNDVKIGAELNKKAYLELAGIDHKKLWEKIRNRKVRTGFSFGECFPKYWKFRTPEFQQFFKQISKTKINLNVKQEFPIQFRGVQYMFAKGGGHSGEKARYIKPNENQILRDADVASMYPHRIKKGNLYPAHLGPLWNTGYISNIPKRVDAKGKYKLTKEKKWDNLQETYKLVLNGNFGRLIDRHDWQYDPFVGMEITIGSQVDIFMLVEDLELAGIHVISLNTDGVVVLMEKDQEETYKQVCLEWEKKVGNDEQGRLEFADYEFLAQLSVNDYIALKVGDEPIEDRIKKKGDFLTEYELYKNKSKRIVPMALEQWFVHGTPVEKTIREHTNLYDFGIAKKASRDYYYKSIDRSTGKELIYNRLIRYYCARAPKSTEQQEIVPGKLYKIKHEHSQKTGPKVSQCESTSNCQIVFNKKVTEPIETLNIDYEWYIAQAKKVLHSIDPEMGRADKIKEKGILELF